MTFRARTAAEHRAAVMELVGAIPRFTETVRLTALEGDHLRTLAGAVLSPIDLPPFDNSQMDGFAVHSADLAAAAPQTPVALPITGHLAAGASGGVLPPGEAWAVMTGAMLPAGADAVVPIEESGLDAFPAAGETVALRVRRPVSSGHFVRPAGSDLPAGREIAAAGSPLTPALIGALASAGIEQVPVWRPLTVLLVATGSEIRVSSVPERPGAILDANTPALSALLTGIGVRVISRGAVPDDPERLLALLDEHAAGVDLVVTAGGVSKGAHEVVREVLASRGVAFGSVAVQPGGPQGLGLARLTEVSVPVVCLPGNPVSALVAAELFLRPALLAAGGWWPDRPELDAPLAEELESPDGKLQIRRGRMTPDGRVQLVGGASSHLLAAFARSQLLVAIPPHITRLDAGDVVHVWRIDG